MAYRYHELSGVWKKKIPCVFKAPIHLVWLLLPACLKLRCSHLSVTELRFGLHNMGNLITLQEWTLILAFKRFNLFCLLFCAIFFTKNCKLQLIFAIKQHAGRAREQWRQEDLFQHHCSGNYFHFNDKNMAKQSHGSTYMQAFAGLVLYSTLIQSRNSCSWPLVARECYFKTRGFFVAVI